MNPKTYSPVPVRGQNLHVISMFANMAGFLVALATHIPPTIPVWAMFAYSSFDFFVAMFAKDFRAFKNAALIRFALFGFMQIMTCVAILSSVIVGDMSRGWEWLWGIIFFLFLYCGVINIGEAVFRQKQRKRDRQKQIESEAKAAIIEGFKRIAEEEKEKKIKESLLVEDSLLESLAFLADIEPKNK